MHIQWRKQANFFEMRKKVKLYDKYTGFQTIKIQHLYIKCNYVIMGTEALRNDLILPCGTNNLTEEESTQIKKCL